MGKMQGEGDYEAARRYREKTTAAASRGAAKKKAPAKSGDERAAAKGKARGKAAGQDKRDAMVMSRKVAARSPAKRAKR